MSDQRDVTEPEVYSSLGTAMKFLALDALLQDLVDATADVDSVSVTITLNVGGVPVIGPKTKEYVRGRADLGGDDVG